MRNVPRSLSSRHGRQTNPTFLSGLGIDSGKRGLASRSIRGDLIFARSDGDLRESGATAILKAPIYTSVGVERSAEGPAMSEDLVSRAVGGEKDALVELLERHGPELRRHLAGKMPERWRSVLSEDDVIQQTYMDAFLCIRRFRPQGDDSFGNWLATLANRNLVDAIRMLDADKRGHDHRRINPGSGDESFVDLYELLGGTSATPSRQAACNEARGAVTQAVEQLPETYRSVVTMYDLEGQPLREVAAAIQRSPGATSMLRLRALRRLAEIMGTSSRFLSESA